MSLVDGILISIFIFYVYSDSSRGFLRVTADFIGLIVAFFLALLTYLPFATVISANFDLSYSSAKPFSFLILWIVFQLIFFGLSKVISFYTPVSVKESKLNRYLAIVPATLKGLVFVVVMIALTIATPLNESQKKMVSESFIVNLSSKYSIGLESRLEKIFGDPASSPEQARLEDGSIDNQRTVLDFSTSAVNIDENAEKIILAKVNEERLKVGLSPLITDDLIRNVSRIHSRDMFGRGYFSHVSEDGQTLFDRLVRANVVFKEAAENIALAPSPQSIHNGLMNSPKHKANILNPSFTRIGIGVINGGKYGLMVTEDFAN